MPRAIQSLSPRKGRPPVHPWDEWVKPGTFEFVQGHKVETEGGEVTAVEGDFYCEVSSFGSQLRAAAKDRGMAVSLRNPEDGIVEAQFSIPTDEDDEDIDA